MKFTQIITEDMAEVKAYRFKPGTKLQEDAALRKRFIRERGERYWSDTVDYFYDFFGAIAEGEDGKLYGIGYVYDDKLIPAVWQEVERKEEKA